MSASLDGPRLPAAYLMTGTSSFSDFLASQAPDLLPSRRSLPLGEAGDLAPHGTTIVAATFPGGVVMAGDRRATMGNIIAQRDIEKVFPADEFSAVGIAGSAGTRGRDGPPVPDRARALREDRGHHLVDGRQGQPAGRPDPLQPRHGDAGTGRRTPLRGLRPVHRRRPHLQLRRHRRPLRGDRVPLRRLRFAVRARARSRSSTARTSTRPSASPRSSRRSTTPPTTTRPRAGPT